MVVVVPSERIKKVNSYKKPELNKLGESEGRAHILKLPLSSCGLFPNSPAEGSTAISNPLFKMGDTNTEHSVMCRSTTFTDRPVIRGCLLGRQLSCCIL